MNCPMCEGKTRVTYSIPDVDSVIRKRECCECGHIFYTSELEDAGAKRICNKLICEVMKKRNARKRAQKKKQKEKENS